MYRANDLQLSMEDYLEPFGGMLDPENRWVKLAEEIDWDTMEERYSQKFGQRGHQATAFRPAFGGLVIRACLGLSDRQTVELIRESPYLQYFLGARQFTNGEFFSARSMAGFRQRIPESHIKEAVRKFRTLDRDD